jgi:tetratricopeptide (TPR) repeat protein
VIVVALAVRAAVQVPVWRDSLTLNANNVAVTPWSYASFNNLGNAYDDVATGLVKEGRLDEALGAYVRSVEMYRESLRTMPDAPPTSKNLAMGLLRVSGLDTNPQTKIPRMLEAARHLEMAAELPAHGKGVDPLLAGELYLRAGNPAKAVEHYEGVLRKDPGNAEAARRLTEARGKLVGQKAPGGT